MISNLDSFVKVSLSVVQGTYKSRSYTEYGVRSIQYIHVLRMMYGCMYVYDPRREEGEGIYGTYMHFGSAHAEHIIYLTLPLLTYLPSCMRDLHRCPMTFV